MAPKKKKSTHKKPGTLVSLAHAGVKYPGSKAVMAIWNQRMGRIKAGGK